MAPKQRARKEGHLYSDGATSAATAPPPPIIDWPIVGRGFPFSEIFQSLSQPILAKSLMGLKKFNKGGDLQGV